MRGTLRVRVWQIKESQGRRRPHGVRWVVDGHQKSEWFASKALADRYRSRLMQAIRNGEQFDTVTGLPESLYRERSSRTLLELSQDFIAHRWPGSAPNTRRRMVDTLAVAVGEFTRSRQPPPDARVLRRALTTHLLPVNTRDSEPLGEIADATRWILRASRPVSELSNKLEVEKLLRRLNARLDGKPAAELTTRTRRGVLHDALTYAVDAGHLTSNLMSTVKITTPHIAIEVDPRIVISPKQARELLIAVTYVGRPGHYEYLVTFFACMYFAALRPAEALALRLNDCSLPDSGWGQLILGRSLSRSNARYIGGADAPTYEQRPLKRRSVREVREVPIPPELVARLRRHAETFGNASDGRLFPGSEGGPIAASVYTGVWKRARAIALLPGSPLAPRPYDLRHAAVSSWLAGGVDVAEVARRAGHTVQVLTTVYAKVLHGRDEENNRKIEALLG